MSAIDTQIANLEDAIAQGTKRVVFISGGSRREVEYHSLKEMREALAALKVQKNGRSRVVLAAF